DPVFSSGVMLALKSGVMSADIVHQAIVDKDYSPERFTDYATFMRQGVENMRKLVYAFYDTKFSFKKVIVNYPNAPGLITACLSGDVNKDFSQLWGWISEFVPLPESMPLGQPLTASLEMAAKA